MFSCTFQIYNKSIFSHAIYFPFFVKWNGAVGPVLQSVLLANKNKNCQESYRWFQTSQTGGQQYSDTSLFSIPCPASASVLSLCVCLCWKVFEISTDIYNVRLVYIFKVYTLKRQLCQDAISPSLLALANKNDPSCAQGGRGIFSSDRRVSLLLALSR